MMKYYYGHPGQKYPVEMDPYLAMYHNYVDSYSKGYYEEVASYGAPGQLDTRSDGWMDLSWLDGWMDLSWSDDVI